MTRGHFIVFEGVDGCGKSTQARRFAVERGGRFAFEPGDSDLGAQLRTWLLDAHLDMTPRVEALLMLSDRSHHVTTVIEPTLDSGIDVVADRFYPSTLAYQGYGRGVPLAELWAATRLAIGDCQPDLTILLDVDISVARSRGATRRDDRFESVPGDFLDRVRQGYVEMAAEDPRRWAIVDGNRPEDEVADAVREVLAKRL